MKVYMKRGIIGFFVGATISYLLVLSGIPALKSVEMTINGEFLRIHFLLTALLGFHLAGSSVVFNQEEWSLLKQTIVHFLCMLPAIPAAYYLGWMPRTSLGALTYVIVFLVLYAVQWTISYLYWKKQVKNMGEYLEAFQKKANLTGLNS